MENSLKNSSDSNYDDSSSKTKNVLDDSTSSSVVDTLQQIITNMDKHKGNELKYVISTLTSKYGISNIQDQIGELSDADLQEPLLNPNNQKFTAFPINYQGIWDLYKSQLACFWKAEEIDFSEDYEDYMTLSNDEKYFVEMILAFFAASDGIVNFNLSERFTREVKVTEAQFTYSFQMMMENVHCVSGDTLILTNNGYKQIKSMVNKDVKVWNGKEFSDTTVKYTEISKLFRVTLSNGMQLDCTPGHNWFIRTGPLSHPELCKREKIQTKDLKIGDVIHKYDLPVVDMADPDEFKNPYVHGFFCGDGTYCNEYPLIGLYGEKKQLLKEFNPKSHATNNDSIRFYITSMINKDKYVVPINYSTNTKLRWLEGFCDADGCTKNNSKQSATSIQLSNTNYNFLKNIQLLLTTLGINTNISISKEKCQELLPDGKGGKKLYDCQQCYVLYITCGSVRKLVNLGFNTKRLKLMIDNTITENPTLIRIESIKELNGFHQTYCFTEPKEHAGVFNGILTGQSETYSLMLDNIIKDKTKKQFLFNAIQTVPAVKMMADWAFKWIDSSESFAHRIVAFAIVEGVFFSGMFAAIFWLKKYKNEGGKKSFMNGLVKSNKFISRDEGLHVQFACELYKNIINKLPAKTVNSIMQEAVKISQNFMTDAIPVKLIGMNSDHMNDYIEYIGDRLLGMLGYKKIFNKKNPFDFMKTIGLDDKTNFFESRPHEYQDSHVMNKGKTLSKITMDKIDDLDF